MSINEGHGIPPWQMWGSTNNLTLNGSGGNTDSRGTQQLAIINYKRPETWTFLLAAKLVNVNAPGNFAGCTCWFEIIVGIGRSTYTFQATPTFDLTIAAPSYFTMQLEGPKRNATDVTPNITRKLGAQSIQCSAFAIFNALPTTQITIEFTSQFCPRTHVRPDWFVEGFLGNEMGGT